MAHTARYDGSAIDRECFDGYVYVVARILTDPDGSSGSDGEHLKDDSFIEVVTIFDVRIIPELGGDCRAFSRRNRPVR